MSVPMTASDVRDCLALRWPDTDYLSIPEAPEDSSRAGRKIDLLVIALWRSRGLERDAVEIKVSMSDWRRELQRAEKADFWWRHSHRFWVAVPAEIADKVRPELPSGWGLLACAPGEKPRQVVKPLKHEAEPLSWMTTVGVMRATADCGLSAIRRAEARGWEQGLKQGRTEAERLSGDEGVRRELTRLREQVQAFEAASGLDISDRWGDAGELGQLVAIVKREKLEPRWLIEGLGRLAENAARQAESLLARAREIQATARRVSDAINAEADREAAA